MVSFHCHFYNPSVFVTVLPFFCIFAEIRNFRSPLKSPNMVFQLQEKNQTTIFVLKFFFRGKKTASCDDFPQTKWRLNSPTQEEHLLKKMVNKFLCARGTRKIRKRRTPLVPKEDKKGLNEPQTTIFHLLTDKIGCK